MVQTTRLLSGLMMLVLVAEAAVTPTPSSFSTTAAVNRGRGAKRAFVSRGGRSRGTPAPAARQQVSTTASTFTSPTSSPRYQQFQDVTPTFAPQPPQQHSTFSPSPSPTFSPTPSTFAPTQSFPQHNQTPVRVPGPAPTPAGAFGGQDVVVTPRRPSAALGFSPSSFSPSSFSPSSFSPSSFSPSPRAAPFSSKQFAKPSGPRGTPVPIVALNFNLRDDGSYSTSSETGDGTVRQEHGQFNGAAMAVKGMYAYRDQDHGPVQVNYVADEFGFQPQGPNIHPAIMMAVADQVNAARSAKSRKGAQGLNGVQDDGELDYEDDNGAGTSPAPIRFKQPNRAVRRVVVRRL